MGRPVSKISQTSVDRNIYAWAEIVAELAKLVVRYFRNFYKCIWPLFQINSAASFPLMQTSFCFVVKDPAADATDAPQPLAYCATLC
jgi:hypothetical protein